jgi:hypothetical protein
MRHHLFLIGQLLIAFAQRNKVDIIIGQLPVSLVA